jgi:hypothetical protein
LPPLIAAVQLLLPDIAIALLLDPLLLLHTTHILLLLLMLKDLDLLFVVN